MVTGRRGRPPVPPRPPAPPTLPQRPTAIPADAHTGVDRCSRQSRSVMPTAVSDAHGDTGDLLVERAMTGGQIGGLVGGVTGSLGGAAYGLRVGMQEARHLSLIYRVLAVSEGAAAGAFAGGATLFPYGAVIGAALFTGVELIVTADRTTTSEPVRVLDDDGC